jgi:hypothetical protein
VLLSFLFGFNPVHIFVTWLLTQIITNLYVKKDIIFEAHQEDFEIKIPEMKRIELSPQLKPISVSPKFIYQVSLDSSGRFGNQIQGFSLNIVDDYINVEKLKSDVSVLHSLETKNVGENIERDDEHTEHLYNWIMKVYNQVNLQSSHSVSVKNLNN